MSKQDDRKYLPQAPANAVPLDHMKGVLPLDDLRGQLGLEPLKRTFGRDKWITQHFWKWRELASAVLKAATSPRPDGRFPPGTDYAFVERSPHPVVNTDPTTLRKFYRLYYFDQVRGLRDYDRYAANPPEQLYYLFLERDPTSLLSHHFDQEVPAALQDFGGRSWGVFEVLSTAWVYGSFVDYVAVCRAADDFDVSVYLDQLRRRLRDNQATAKVLSMKVVDSV